MIGPSARAAIDDDTAVAAVVELVAAGAQRRAAASVVARLTGSSAQRALRPLALVVSSPSAPFRLPRVLHVVGIIDNVRPRSYRSLHSCQIREQEVGRAPFCIRLGAPRSTCPNPTGVGLVVAVAWRRPPSLLARAGPVRSRPAPGRRRRRVGRRGGACSGSRSRVVRRCRTVLWPDGHDPDRRVRRLAHAPR